MATRNGVLWRAFGTTSRALLETTVPAGEVWIIKWISLNPWSGSSQNISVQLHAPSSGPVVYLYSADVATGTKVNQSCWFTAEPGDRLTCSWSDSRLDICLGGARLPV